MEVVPKPNIVSDRIKTVLDDLHCPEHIKDPPLKQLNRQTSLNI
jgi:hypothetical protein